MNGVFDGFFWQYAMLFVLAATPWIELLFVIPLGIAMGLGPISVALDVFAGNTLPVFLIVFGYDRWRTSRSPVPATEDLRPGGRRRTRALRIFNKYGLPGLAMAGPLLTGIHLATIIALFFNPDRRKLLFWMTTSLLFWTVALTVVSHGGLEAVRHWLV
ncbi:MAG TPA: hypothetical protein ENN35_03700 [Deltaproteobacteria bacterium]|nr:hypothetical protein [Deltaproteobacteria bacterium]